MARPKKVVKGKVVPVVFIDKQGRITIPKEIRDKVSADAFVILIIDGGKILLDPIKI